MERLSRDGEPFPFGLTFVPTEALASLAADEHRPALALVRAALALGASFAFIPSVEPWADEAAAALSEEDVAPIFTVSGPLWPIIRVRGIVEGLRATLTRPEEIGEELDAALGVLLAEVERAAASGARALVLAEDLAGTHGPLVAPDFAIGELVPRYERIVRVARTLGLPTVFHSDGDIRPLLPALSRAGFVALHAGGGLSFGGFERVFWAARAEGLAVMGGLVTAELANPARAETLGSKAGVLAHAGGLLLSDDGGITSASEVTSLVTALAAARDT